jgi:MerR family transcriptional regulator/heat shock protein HspR
MKREIVNRRFSYFVISTVAEITGLHPQTLRIYERKGLLLPDRTSGGSRRYSQTDIDTLTRIQELRKAGLNLAGIKKVLLLESEIKELQQQISDVQF